MSEKRRDLEYYVKQKRYEFIKTDARIATQNRLIDTKAGKAFVAKWEAMTVVEVSDGHN